ncbi:MAG: metal ABC transporter solute-binding protein, Zn/Mn family [Planctomycetota bacterium]
MKKAAHRPSRRLQPCRSGAGSARLLLASTLVGALLALLVSGCGGESAIAGSPEAGESAPRAGPESRPLRITCTVGMLTDLVRQVGGDRVDATGLMGPGTDPHLYKASPGDLKQLLASDLIIYCGHHLEGRMAEVFSRIARQRPTVAVCERIEEEHLLTPEGSAGAVDPHLWFDVRNWMRVTEIVRETLSLHDPGGERSYRSRAARLLERLDELDGEVRARIAEIPPGRRVLITAHDAFRYFGRAYGIEVLGIQGISTQSEAGVRRINELAALIARREVRAVFVESTVSEKNVRSLIEGCGALGHDLKIGGSLFSDAMGAEGTPEGTYIGMVRHNVNTIVEALR